VRSAIRRAEAGEGGQVVLATTNGRRALRSLQGMSVPRAWKVHGPEVDDVERALRDTLSPGLVAGALGTVGPSGSLLVPAAVIAVALTEPGKGRITTGRDRGLRLADGRVSPFDLLWDLLDRLVDQRNRVLLLDLPDSATAPRLFRVLRTFCATERFRSSRLVLVLAVDGQTARDAGIDLEDPDEQRTAGFRCVVLDHPRGDPEAMRGWVGRADADVLERLATESGGDDHLAEGILARWLADGAVARRWGRLSATARMPPAPSTPDPGGAAASTDRAVLEEALLLHLLASVEPASEARVDQLAAVGEALIDRGWVERADEAARTALQVLGRVTGPAPGTRVDALRVAGTAATRAGDLALGMDHLEAALTLASGALAEEDRPGGLRQEALIRTEVGTRLTELGRADAARAQLAAAMARTEEDDAAWPVAGEQQRARATLLMAQARLARALDPSEASRLLEGAVRADRALAAEHGAAVDRTRLAQSLVELAAHTADPDRATALLTEAQTVTDRLLRKEPGALAAIVRARVLLALGQLLHADDPARAGALVDEAEALLRVTLADDAPAEAAGVLAEVLHHRHDRVQEARPVASALLDEGVDLCRQVLRRTPTRRARWQLSNRLFARATAEREARPRDAAAWFLEAADLRREGPARASDSERVDLAAALVEHVVVGDADSKQTLPLVREAASILTDLPAASWGDREGAIARGLARVAFAQARADMQRRPNLSRALFGAAASLQRRVLDHEGTAAARTDLARTRYECALVERNLDLAAASSLLVEAEALLRETEAEAPTAATSRLLAHTLNALGRLRLADPAVARALWSEAEARYRSLDDPARGSALPALLEVWARQERTWGDETKASELEARAAELAGPA
jgi:tetratricopeptide (TPR) repeat protein